MEYRVKLYSRDGNYPHRWIDRDQQVDGNEIRLSRGIIKLERCAGVEYDLQVRDYSTNDPILALSSQEPAFFFTVDVLLDYMSVPKA